jgi:type IV secretion system protein VirB5
MSKGPALIGIGAVYSSRNSHDTGTAHWTLAVTYYLNPKQISEQTRVLPQSETINPVGMTISKFRENRIGVDQATQISVTTKPVIAAGRMRTIVPAGLPRAMTGETR